MNSLTWWIHTQRRRNHTHTHNNVHWMWMIQMCRNKHSQHFITRQTVSIFFFHCNQFFTFFFHSSDKEENNSIVDWRQEGGDMPWMTIFFGSLFWFHFHSSERKVHYSNWLLVCSIMFRLLMKFCCIEVTFRSQFYDSQTITRKESIHTHAHDVLEQTVQCTFDCLVKGNTKNVWTLGTFFFFFFCLFCVTKRNFSP